MLEHGHEPADIAERINGDTGRSYLRDSIYGAIDGAVTTFAIVAGVVGAELSGYHVFMPGSSRRHADLTWSGLLATHYPDVDPSTPDLIDDTSITAATGWRSSYPERGTE